MAQQVPVAEVVELTGRRHDVRARIVAKRRPVALPRALSRLAKSRSSTLTSRSSNPPIDSKSSRRHHSTAADSPCHQHEAEDHSRDRDAERPALRSNDGASPDVAAGADQAVDRAASSATSASIVTMTSPVDAAAAAVLRMRARLRLSSVTTTAPHAHAISSVRSAQVERHDDLDVGVDLLGRTGYRREAPRQNTSLSRAGTSTEISTRSMMADDMNICDAVRVSARCASTSPVGAPPRRVAWWGHGRGPWIHVDPARQLVAAEAGLVAEFPGTRAADIHAHHHGARDRVSMPPRSATTSRSSWRARCAARLRSRARAEPTPA